MACFWLPSVVRHLKRSLQEIPTRRRHETRHRPPQLQQAEEAVTTHLKWDAKVDFDQRQITATATYQVQTAKDAERLLLDCRDLTIHSVTVDGQDAPFELGPVRPFLGQPLSIPVTGTTKEVSVAYTTSPDAAAFLWVEGESPFLFTQSQAILARTWVPCQDSPGVRFTYEAHVEVPTELMALMSAVNPTEKSADGHYDFVMEQPIPSYLLALAVGDVEFRSVGAHTGVYATSDLIDASEYEFAEMEDMLVAAEGSTANTLGNVTTCLCFLLLSRLAAWRTHD